jgi:hypothetical protein
MFQPEHFVKVYQLLGDGQQDAGWMGEHISRNRLAVLPDLTHYEIFFALRLSPYRFSTAKVDRNSAPTKCERRHVPKLLSGCRRGRYERLIICPANGSCLLHQHGENQRRVYHGHKRKVR